MDREKRESKAQINVLQKEKIALQAKLKDLEKENCIKENTSKLEATETSQCKSQSALQSTVESLSARLDEVHKMHIQKMNELKLQDKTKSDELNEKLRILNDEKNSFRQLVLDLEKQVNDRNDEIHQTQSISSIGTNESTYYTRYESNHTKDQHSVKSMQDEIFLQVEERVMKLFIDLQSETNKQLSEDQQQKALSSRQLWDRLDSVEEAQRKHSKKFRDHFRDSEEEVYRLEHKIARMEAGCTPSKQVMGKKEYKNHRNRDSFGGNLAID
eukprot:CAMPEP_0171295872 /NCGR_PEP_ID=MMETSP0816-20121228/4522_1 /TAXON_ID=420281 /ORGANISM="Proboscia inermis, Strain CCAP1064/1" /LENGTH=270 /DNA_ID=CAMNT_0011768879 /DNA_START=108 /DNA_END=920 /DNA_ORIENTATION=-